jgi:hypothetical protein
LVPAWMVRARSWTSSRMWTTCALSSGRSQVGCEPAPSRITTRGTMGHSS